MRAATSPWRGAPGEEAPLGGAELARWAAPSHPGNRATRICSPQMRVVWLSGVCVPGAGLRGSLSPLSLTPEPRARLRGAVREQYRICKSEQTKKESTEPEPDTATWTHTTHTDTDRHTHTRTDATRPFRGIQSRIHQFRQCCTACKRGQLAQAEAAWHGAHFLYQAVSSPAALL